MGKLTPLPVVISVPHGGTTVPESVRPLCRLDAYAFLRDGDTWARQLYALEGIVEAYIDTQVPRAVVDMNRAPDDLPPENPDGVVKTVTVQGDSIWKYPGGLPASKVDYLIRNYHHPYHDSIEVASKGKGLLLGIDCHTMLSFGPVAGPDPGASRPLITIGNRGDADGEEIDEGLTAPPKLVRALRDAARAQFANEDVEVALNKGTVTLNQPFRGGYIARRHALLTKLPWVQFELNRSLYMGEEMEINETPGSVSLNRLEDLRKKFIKGLRSIL